MTQQRNKAYIAFSEYLYNLYGGKRMQHLEILEMLMYKLFTFNDLKDIKTLMYR